MLDAIEHLARDDKWYLGAGDGTLFAPTYPAWLDTPGFWDEATIYQYAFAPLFTVAVLDAAGRELQMRATSRRWTPADLTVTYRLETGITATEVRTVHPGGVFVSEWRFAAFEPASVHLVAWTAQDGASVPLGEAAWSAFRASYTTAATNRCMCVRNSRALAVRRAMPRLAANAAPHNHSGAIRRSWSSGVPAGCRVRCVTRGSHPTGSSTRRCIARWRLDTRGRRQSSP
jgi:hypothetical protein